MGPGEGERRSGSGSGRGRLKVRQAAGTAQGGLRAAPAGPGASPGAPPGLGSAGRGASGLPAVRLARGAFAKVMPLASGKTSW